MVADCVLDFAIDGVLNQLFHDNNIENVLFMRIPTVTDGGEILRE